MKQSPRFLPPAALVLLLSATAAQAQQAPVAPPCVIVFSKGQNAGIDVRANRMWNNVNNAFGQSVAAQFRQVGRRVVEMPYSVEAADLGANTDDILRRAQQEGCDLVAAASMYADQASSQFRSSLRINPVVVSRSEASAGTVYTAGNEVFKKEQADPLTKETLDRLVPSQVAKSLVDAYLAAPR